MKFETRSFFEWNPVDSGYEQLGPNEYVGYATSMRIHLRRVDGGWVSTIDVLVGVKVLDIDECPPNWDEFRETWRDREPLL